MAYPLLELHAVASAPIVYGIVQPGPEFADGVPFVQTRDLRSPLDLANLNRTSKAIARAYRRSELETGDLLVALRGEIGSIQRVPPRLHGGNISRGVARLRVGPSFDANYVRHALGATSTKQTMLESSAGSALTEISIGQLRKISIPAPPLAIQKMIAAILGAWDRAVILEDSRLSATWRRYSAIRIKELAPHRARDMRPLRDVVTPITRKNDGQSHPVMAISSRHGFILQSDKYRRDMTGAGLGNYTLLKQGEFSYNRGNSSSFPFGCIYSLSNASALVPSVYISFRLAKGLRSAYYEHFFAAGLLNAQLAQRISSGARGNGLLNINPRDFFSTEIPIPPLREQDRVADALNAMSDEIEILQRRIELLRQQKRGLTQRLLSGELRVNDRAEGMSPT